MESRRRMNISSNVHNANASALSAQTLTLPQLHVMINTACDQLVFFTVASGCHKSAFLIDRIWFNRNWIYEGLKLSMAMCWWPSKSVYAMGKSETGPECSRRPREPSVVGSDGPTDRRGTRQSKGATASEAVKVWRWKQSGFRSLQWSELTFKGWQWSE